MKKQYQQCRGIEGVIKTNSRTSTGLYVRSQSLSSELSA